MCGRAAYSDIDALVWQPGVNVHVVRQLSDEPKAGTHEPTKSADIVSRQCRTAGIWVTTPWVKKTRHQTLGHNFTNYYPIFKIFSLADSVVNLQQTHV